MKHYYYRIVFLAINAFSILLWVMSKDSLSALSVSPLRTIAQLTAILAITNLSLEFLLSTRHPFLNTFFGGLDKAYKAHHFVGGLALSFMLLHVIFLILGSLSPISSALVYFLPSATLSYNLGKISLGGFILLLVLTFYVKLKYHIWKNTHTFLILPLIFAGLHIITITSDVSRSIPLRIWVITLIIVAVLSYLYLKVFKLIFPSVLEYRVKEIAQEGNCVHLSLSPVDKRLNYKPGQFAFIQFHDPSIPNESHPFSMTSDPNNSDLTFTMKADGDWTSMLSNVKPGTKATVSGPFGHFGSRTPQKNTTSIWIAGGIGMTPFLSMLSKVTTTSGIIYLYYLTKNKEDAVLDNRIRAIITANKLSNVNYQQHASEAEGRLTAQDILKNIHEGTPIIHLCGPSSMMKSYHSQFTIAGIPSKDIIYEEFDLR